MDLKQESIFKKKYGSPENLLKKGIWASRNKVADTGEKENEMQENTDMNLNRCNDEREAADIKTSELVDEESRTKKYYVLFKGVPD